MCRVTENKKKNVKNDAAPTVIKPQTSPELNPEATVIAERRTSSSQHELTRIRQSIRTPDNSTGFETAKQEADNALQQHKIVLNSRFVLESTIGAGGMGTVYKAQDLRKVEANDINTEIAVKVLNDEFKNHPDAFVSLQREASRSHILSHPNIVTVHDFDRDGDIIFMTMELLDGRPLDSLLRDFSGTGMRPEQAIPIIKDYCSGLSFAHKKHFIHSDLKPGNLFVCDEGTIILDFGIARINSASVIQDHFDAGDLGALTPAYASLEMLNGEAPHPSDDVYAAALIAYELFSGKHPFDRLPADQVKAKKLKPKRLKELNQRQWHALESALIVERDKRTQSIDEFWNSFANKKHLPIFIFTSAILLPVTIWFGYNTYIAPSEMSKLADSTFIKANDCLTQKDAQCAIDGIKSVLKLDPTYSGAQLLLEKANTLKAEQTLTANALKLEKKLTELLNDIQQCTDVDHNLICAEKVLYSMQNLDADAAQTIVAESKLTLFKENQNIATLLQQSQQCLQEKSYDCVIKNTQTILNIRPDNTQAITFNKQAKDEIIALENQRVATQRKYTALMLKGNKCFKSKSYQCAQTSAEKALILHSTDEARTLQRNAEMALIEQKRNLLEQKRNKEKADNMVAQAKLCFTKKQYDCAIAKSESALNFIPKYTPALNTLKKATEERQKIKNSFSLK